MLRPPSFLRKDDHVERAALTALRTLSDVGARAPLHESGGRLQGAWKRRGHVEHAPAGRQGLRTAPIAEQPVMAQALEAPGKPMQQEASDELDCREAHHLHGVALSIIAPAEVDDAVLQGDEALIAAGDAMGRAPEVRPHLLGAGEGWLGIDDPLLLPDRVQPWDKRGGLRERCRPRGTVQLPLGEGMVEAIEIFPAKDP